MAEDGWGPPVRHGSNVTCQNGNLFPRARIITAGAFLLSSRGRHAPFPWQPSYCLSIGERAASGRDRPARPGAIFRQHRLRLFHATLSDYGDWLYSDRWGEVWRPLAQDRDDDWRPYWAGHWAFTREYGWTWISDEGEWGDIAYHYGRWVYDPYDGWLWLPGYVWSPAWVVWRSSGPDVGWMPMPPDDGFLRPGFSISIGFGDWSDIGGYYGYSRWYGSSFDRARFGRLWTFVPGERLADPGYRRYALARPQTINIIQNSRNITNYTVVNNVIINRSVNDAAMRGGRAPQPVAANTVLRNTRWVTPVNQGEQI